MKRLIAFFLAVILLLLPSCTVQGTMSPEIFISRLGEIYPPAGEGTQLLFEQDNAYCFIKCESGSQILIGMALSDDSTVTKVSVTADCADKTGSAEFSAVAQKSITVFAMEETESIERIISEIGMANGEYDGSAKYFDTKWYRYAFIPTDEGVHFSVESRRAVPDSEVEFSLRKAG